MHFCHGATGAIPMLISAYHTFKDNVYLESLLKTGEMVWNNGLLKKGNGICQGITGNGYVLHSIYRLTKDVKWLNRAYRFALCTFDQEI